MWYGASPSLALTPDSYASASDYCWSYSYGTYSGKNRYESNYNFSNKSGNVSETSN